MATIFHAAGRSRIPWKNGGGEAEDIASGPPDASWEAMDWRVSRAWISKSGPFSIFPGIDRTFLVVEGPGVELAPAGLPVRVDQAADPFRFPGDAVTECRLLGGPVVALNVMTARGRWRHRVERRPLRGPTALVGAAPVSVAIVLRGGLALAASGARLAPADAIRLLPDEAVAVEPEPGTVLAWMEIRPEG